MIHEVNSVFHKIVISKKDIINLAHFADAREILRKLERCAQNANRCGCYRAISVRYFLIKETSKGDAMAAPIRPHLPRKT